MAKEQDMEFWFRDHHVDVYSFLVYLCGRRDVEDLVQETFLRAYRGMEQFSGRSTPKTWLFAIARNVVRDDMRKQQRAPLVAEIGETDLTTDVTPEILATLNETQAEVMTAVQKLRPNYRDVLILRGIFELSVQETAETLNWNSTRVRVTFFRALKALRTQIIREEGMTSHEWIL